MASINKLTIELDGIGHTISDNKLIVPPNQRSYAWEETHVNDLIDDILTSIRKSEEEYFIGSIVVSSGTERQEVVDGQQRLATITILIAAIRDYFMESGDTNRAEDIQRKYLSSRDLRSQEVIPNLILNSNDNYFFYNNVVNVNSDSMSPSRGSHDRIESAIRLVKRKLRNHISNDNDPSRSLIDLCDFIDMRLKLIVVKVPNHANAFTIFETLNDRGLDLAISDLLKNALLGRAESRLNEVQENWTRMYSLLENTENESLVVTFLRHYWSSQHGLTRERDLYERIREKITSKQRAVDFSVQLEKAAAIYVALIDTKSVFWDDYTDIAKEHMATLNLFGMIQMRPLLLSIFDKFKREEIETSLKFLVAVSTRLLIYGGLGGGALELHFSTRAKEIADGEVSTASQLRDKFSKVVPSDTQFKEAFATASVAKQYLARYYLRALERTANGETNPELVPNSDTASVNLEHIMPRTLNDSWRLDIDTHRAYLKRLGNLALMSSKLNAKDGNSSFEKKKIAYSTSAFKLTSMLEECPTWNIDEINKRQQLLAELAVTTWKV